MPAKPVPGGCTEESAAMLLAATQILVTSSSIKSDVVPALWAGAASLFSGGKGLKWFRCARFTSLREYFGCCNYFILTDARRVVAGGTFVVSEPART